MVISSRMAGDESPLTSTSPRYPSPLHFAKTAIAPANCHVAPSRVSARHHPNLPVLLRGIWKKALFKCKVQNFSHGFHLPYAIAQYRADDLLKVNSDGSRKLILMQFKTLKWRSGYVIKSVTVTASEHALPQRASTGATCKRDRAFLSSQLRFRNTCGAVNWAPNAGCLFNSRSIHMSNSNSGSSSSGNKSGGQQGSNSGTSGSGSKGSEGTKGGRSSESQQDQSSSKQKSPGSTQGGTHEQHVKAGQQSHKND